MHRRSVTQRNDASDTRHFVAPSDAGAIRTPAATMPAFVYIFADGLRSWSARVTADGDVSRSALEALMAGPTTVEATGRDPARAGRFTRLTTAIPGGTVIRDVRAAEDPGVLTVDLSEAFLDGTAGDRIAAVERAAGGPPRPRFRV